MSTGGRTSRLGTWLVVVALVAGCDAVAPPRDDTGGPGLPVQIDGEQYEGPAVEVEGVLVAAENGCFLLDVGGIRHFTVWPSGFGWGGDAVVTPEGRRLSPGTGLRGTGRAVPLAQMPGGPDGYWGSVGGFCDVGTDLLVLDDAEEVDR